jgi:hypothetical protein
VSTALPRSVRTTTPEPLSTLLIASAMR